MRVRAGNLWAEVGESTREEDDAVYQYLSAPVPGAEHTQAFKSGRWDGREHFYKDGKFPTGFVRLVAGLLQKKGHQLAVQDLRGDRPLPMVTDAATWLYPYQAAAVSAFMPRTRGVIEAPTGSGKSEIAVAMGVLLTEPRVLVLVDTRDLMHQMAERWQRRTGQEAGLFGDGQHRPGRFTVATFQSLDLRDQRARDLLEGAGVLVVDEVQVLPANENFRVAMATPNAYYRLGISATPTGRLDGRDHRVIAALGPLVHRIPRDELVRAGAIADGEIRFVRFDQPKATGSFGEVYEAAVVLNEPRNRLVVELAHLAPKPALVFVKLDQHGKILERMLRDAGLRAEIVNGKVASGGRAAAIAGLEDGRLDVVIASKVFNKGVDIPGLRGVVNAAAGRSAHDAIQRAGRAGRAADGKDGFVFYDVDDRKSRWLQKHALERKAAYREAGFRVVEIAALEGGARAGA